MAIINAERIEVDASGAVQLKRKGKVEDPKAEADQAEQILQVTRAKF